MLTPRLAAVLFLLVALMLFAVALLPQAKLQAALSSAAGHSVTVGYVERVHTRALVCGVIALAIASWSAVAMSQRFGRAGEARLNTRAVARTRPTGLATALLGVGVLTRAVLLNGPPHYDEAFTVAEFARQSPLFFLSRYTHANNHVFHTLLVWLVPGDALWAARLPAFLAGIGVLVATYELGRRWHGEVAAHIALALAAFASPLVEYSVQARGYTTLTLAFLLLFLIEDDRLRALALALGAWTIPTMLYAAAGWALWMAVTQRAWRRIAFVAFAGGALTFLLYLPIFIISGLDSIVANGTTLSVPYPVLFRELPPTFVELAKNWSYSFTVPVAIVLAIAALYAMIRGNAPALACTLAAIAILLLVLRKVPFARVWVFVMPLFLIAAASVIAKVRIPAPLLVVATVAFAANAVRVTARDAYVEDPAMRDAAQIAKSIEGLPPGARVLVTTPLDSAYALYVPERIVQDRFDSDPAQVRAALLAAPRRYAVISQRAGDAKIRALPFTPVPILRMPHSTLVELR